MKITTLIVNYNLAAMIQECLHSVQAVNHPDFEHEIIVVDNNSTDGSVAAIRKAFPSVVLIENKTNRGFAGGNNDGITYALGHGSDFVLILNPDVVVDPDLVSELYRGFSSADVGITVPKIYFASGFEFHKDRYTDDQKGKVIWYAGGVMDWHNIIGSHRGVDEVDTGQYDEPTAVQLASGNCLLVKREVFEQVGMFDERYFLYYEDADFSMRVKRAGFIIRYYPKAKLWHKNGQAAGGSGSPLQDYFISRNRLVFGYTYASLRTKFALFRESIRSLFSYPTRRHAVIDFYTGKLGKGSFIHD